MARAARAFVIRPFHKKKDSAGKELDFERIHQELIGPALQAAGLGGATTGEIVEAGNIREDMFSLILEADLIVCDITLHNANVFYELGIRHALRKGRTVLIRGTPPAERIPFDLLTDRYLAYEIDNPGSARYQLIATIEATLRSDRPTDSPVFRMLPALREADPTTLQVVPLDFREEVERALAASSKGWLRLLAHDVRRRRFQWSGLRLVASAQWKVKDYLGARASLEAIREVQRHDVQASLDLANIYERLYRLEERPEHLVASDHAIERVLASESATSGQRVEALALKGRNQKTRWRQEFAGLASPEERRQAAMNEALRKSYQAYRQAFYQNLNHFWSGLAVLQIGTLFLDLAAGDDPTWTSSFDTDEKAYAYRSKLEQDVEALELLIPASVEAALQQMSPTDPDRIWAQISKADLLFLKEPNEQRVIKRYLDVLPRDNPFAWDAVRGQLELFSDLEVRGELARAVITTVDRHRATRQPEEDMALHLVLFAGHRVDAPGRAESRFPAARADRAKALIREALGELNQELPVLALASGASGADLLFHEVCAELNIPTKLCLPMPRADYARLEFPELDDWRSRFLNLLQTNSEVLELSDRAGFPAWLQDAGTDPWERGNRWVLEMALASPAKKRSLIALWDGKTEGDARGGTAHMVQLARNSGRIDVKIISTEPLLA